MPPRKAHARTPSLVAINQNTAWLSAPGVWTAYLATLLLAWLLLCAVAEPRQAWDILVLLHFGITFFLFHWHKGSPIASDQGAYDKLTFWEQMDDGVQLTRNKKFFTVLPVLLFLPSWQKKGVDTNLMDVATLAATVVLLLAKMVRHPFPAPTSPRPSHSPPQPFMYRVRILGYNND